MGGTRVETFFPLFWSEGQLKGNEVLLTNEEISFRTRIKLASSTIRISGYIIIEDYILGRDDARVVIYYFITFVIVMVTDHPCSRNAYIVR